MFKRAALALLFSSVLSVAAIAEGQRVILVLDASGSMRAKINGTLKMDIAKEVVGRIVKSWKPEDDLGLVVYGHREKDNCSDIETMLPPGPLTPSTFMSPVNSLSPKGKTPMTQAVRQAAEALKYTEQKSTVILVSDGIENCEADPCAVAKELEQAGIGFTVHTVGFGLDNKDAIGQLKCLAEETGGIAVLADDADELETALKQTVEAKVEEPPPAPAPEPVIAKEFTGHAVMAEGVELPPPFDQVVWTFHTALEGQPGEYLSTEYGKSIAAEMKGEGDLVAVLTSDMVKVAVPFSHSKQSPYTLNANLNAGIVQFQGLMDEETPLGADGGTWTVSTAQGEYVGTGYGVAPKHLLAAGDYKVKLEAGQAVAEAAFTVAPGKVTETVVSLGAGVLKVHVTYDGKQPVADGQTVELRKPADISGTKLHVATEYGNDRTFKAAAGDYVVVVTLNLASAEVPAQVLAGKAGEVTVNLNAGFLAVQAAGAYSVDIQQGTAGIDGKRARLGSEFGDKLNQAVNAGSYHVVAMSSDGSVLAEKDVTVAAGQRVEITLP